MNHANFDVLTRRYSLVTLGPAVLAALVHPITAGAKKRNKKRKKGDANNLKLCKRQVGQCEDFLTEFCEGDPECLVADRCCPTIGNCDFDAFLFCLDASEFP